jgi:hypothetical protein
LFSLLLHSEQTRTIAVFKKIGNGNFFFPANSEFRNPLFT